MNVPASSDRSLSFTLRIGFLTLAFKNLSNFSQFFFCAAPLAFKEHSYPTMLFRVRKVFVGVIFTNWNFSGDRPFPPASL